jgi:hypothetical protein
VTETAEQRKAELLAELAGLDAEPAAAAEAGTSEPQPPDDSEPPPAAETQTEAKESNDAAAPLPAPVDPASLTPEQQKALAALREIEEHGREQLDRKYPTAWNPAKSPEHPKEIPAAIIIRIDPNVGPSPYGGFSAVLEIRDGQGREWSIWCNKPTSPDDGGSKLWNTLLRLKLQPLEVIALRDNGSRPSERDPNKTVHDITLVRVSDETGPERVDYDELQRAPEVPVQTERKPEPEPDDDIPF